MIEIGNYLLVIIVAVYCVFMLAGSMAKDKTLIGTIRVIVSVFRVSNIVRRLRSN